jgi:hypothetical protein
MPDRAEHHAGRTIEFATAVGRVIVAPALMQVAARCGAEVLFTEVHIEDGYKLVGTITAPSAGTPDTITNEFIEFVQARAEARVDALAACSAQGTQRRERSAYLYKRNY